MCFDAFDRCFRVLKITQVDVGVPTNLKTTFSYPKIVFWLYLGAILADQREIWNRDEESHARSREQNCDFRKLKMEDGRHFENSFISISQPWIIRFQSNLAHRYKFSIPSMQVWQKIDAILKIVFGNISAPHRPIYTKFGSEIQNHMPIQDTWPKLQFSKIEDGRRPPFWK